MSRCFPFPPPGYEKKFTTNETAGSLRKEKKHKRDKKDKEKKKNKDKERSKDKHKERKERKEKHKDRKDKEKSRTSVDKDTGDREKLVPNNVNVESKFTQDFERRIRDGEEATESQTTRKIDFPNRVPQTNHVTVDEKRFGNLTNVTPVKRSQNGVLCVPSCIDQEGAEFMVKPVEKKDVQEKFNRRGSVTKSDKLLDSEGIEKNEPKNITERSNKENKEEKREVTNKIIPEKPKSVDTKNLRVQNLSKASDKNVTIEGILGKRKELETNGVLYENGFRPNKIQKPVASPIPSVENGRKLGPLSELQGTMCNPEVKDHKSNGYIHQPVSKAKENGKASAKKRPHPDLKYLDHILNVPEKEGLHENEQEWLFGQPRVKLLNMQRAGPLDDDNTMQVWNMALRLDFTDTIALPYVVPF